ncbi:MAG TPA: shikimate dehydrogenase [Pyrinomonadaceae bacterium]|nr:shikimate dehydrogenase [Pyrinomonadaceae bacterium]
MPHPFSSATSDTSVRLCIPVCVRRAEELRAAVGRAAEDADLIELRLDCLEDEAQLEQATLELPALFRERTRPLILTLRAPEQGGERAPGDELNFERRVRFWSENFSTGSEHADYADLELDMVAHFQLEENRRAAKLIDWDKVICSHHDFARVPADLENIFARLLETPARILKLAFAAADITDSLHVFRLLEEARRAGREMICVAMGEAGRLTRILAPAHGAFLTFGALTREHSTAPGQVTARELRTLYRINLINKQTEIYGLAGSPVAHSLSPHMHNAGFAALGLDAVYMPFEIGDVQAFIRRMADPRTRELKWNVRGLSVTAPHKSACMSSLDWIEPAAQEIGAVNTVVVAGDALKGYNTDAAAALAPLVNKFELERGARVAVLGAGGAARAVLWSLREAGARATVFARDTERARPTAEKFGAHLQTLDGARFNNFDLVINTTPLGTRGARETETPALAAQLRGARCAYDLVYNPGETRFMREARTAGCKNALGGLPMLVAQAAAQFKLWTGQDAPLEVFTEAAEKQLQG